MDDLTMLRELGNQLDVENGEMKSAVRQRMMTVAAVEGTAVPSTSGHWPEWTPRRRSGVRVALPVGAAVLVAAMAVTVTVLLRPGVQPGGGAVGSDRSGVSASGPAVGVSSPAPASDAFVYTQSRVIEWSDPWRQTASGKTVKQVPKRRATVRETWISVDGSRAGGEGADGSLNLDFTGCKNAAVGSPVCRPDPGYQANFPTTVDAIRRTLHRDYPDTRKDDGEGVFDAIGEVMLERLVPSASRAALFQLALTSPGVVRVAGTSTIDGVSGVLLTRKSRLHQEELLFDGQTDELIGRATVPLLPSGQAGPLSSVGAYVQVVVDRGVVTKFGVRPAGTTVPSKK